jgi:hypothetical protein
VKPVKGKNWEKKRGNNSKKTTPPQAKNIGKNHQDLTGDNFHEVRHHDDHTQKHTAPHWCKGAARALKTEIVKKCQCHLHMGPETDKNPKGRRKISQRQQDRAILVE